MDIENIENGMCFTLRNAVQRTNSMVIEENQEGYQASIPISDLVIKDWKNRRGTFKIRVEFTPNG